MLPYLKSSLDFHSSYVEKIAKQAVELVNKTGTKTQNNRTSACSRQPETFVKKLFGVYYSSQKGNVSTKTKKKTRSVRKLEWW